MPASALLSATIEIAANKCLELDIDSKARIARLQGARLIAYIDPLPFAITLAFSERIDVLIEHAPFDTTAAHLQEKECCIKTSLQTVPELQHTNQLTRLIQQQKLKVEGELSVAQHASDLFRQLNIDIEEVLASKTNDVVAHQSIQIINTLQKKASSVKARLERVAGNAIVEEKQLAAHKLAVMHFSDEVNALRDDTARLEARLHQLEQKMN